MYTYIKKTRNIDPEVSRYVKEFGQTKYSAYTYCTLPQECNYLHCLKKFIKCYHIAS